MYWSASATLWTRSSRLMVVMEALRPSVRRGAGRDVLGDGELLGPGDGQRRDQEGDVDQRLPHQGLLVVVGGVDERLQQVDRRDADDRGRELDLEHAGVDVREPLGLVGMGLELQPRDERLPAA